MSNVLKQVNAKIGGVNWQLEQPKATSNMHKMFIGIDAVQCGRTSIVGMAASSN